MKFKFNVGDKVKYVGDWSNVEEDSFLRDYGYVTIKKQLNLLGHPFYEIVEDDSEDAYNEKLLELVKKAESVKLKYSKPTKDELLDMPKGTKIFTDAKEDNEFVYDGNRLNSLNKFLYKSNISDDLKIINIDSTFSDDFGTHITKIEVPKDYETVYVYEEETMESLRKLNEELTKKVTELKRKLYEKNSQDVNISKQELDIINDFFERR